MNSKPDLESKHQAALEAMRVAFDGMDGIGMPLNDQTFLRYLRARYKIHLISIKTSSNLFLLQ